jgi:hypothetical protein
MSRGAQQSHVHHYVPRWYQKRFLAPGTTNFFLLDLNPEIREWTGGRHRLKEVRRRGPGVCFCHDDLYAIKFGRQATDVMEKLFFGVIDDRGRHAVEHFAEYAGISDETHTAFDNLAPYMGAQRFRTPRALDLIKKRTGTAHHNIALAMLREVFQSHTTMWTEGVWEVVRARQSPTKFVVSDDPVTFYCKTVFPSEWRYPNEMSLKQIGTRTIFPLGLESCLIITHLQLARNPWSTPTEIRANAREYQHAVKHLGDIQFGRELEEDDVLRINYILKRRATRYVAAAEEEWLYPERRVSTTDWPMLDGDWFLFPNLWNVSFTTGIAWGDAKGRGFAMDEYGRTPGNPMYEDPSQRRRDSVMFDRAQHEWAKKRAGKSRAEVDDRLARGVGNAMMDNYLRREGLLAGPIERPWD